MRNSIKIVNLATALSALIAPAVAPEFAQAKTTDDTHISKASDAELDVKTPRGEDLMSFTVHESADGAVVAQHMSHASHASHSSHTSSAY